MNAGNALVVVPSFTRMTMPLVVATSALVGVPRTLEMGGSGLCELHVRSFRMSVCDSQPVRARLAFTESACLGCGLKTL